MSELSDAPARPSRGPVSHEALETLFLNARSHNGWTDRPVPETLLRRIYATAVMGPTATNSQPQRIVFVTSVEAKSKLVAIMDEGNRRKVAQAPVTALFAYDLFFPDRLPETFPHADAKSWYNGDAQLILETARRNGSLQAAYFMIAARAHGLDVGPMSGFDPVALKAAFFPEMNWQPNFVCSLGYGNGERMFDRLPRLGFDSTSLIL